MQFAVDENDNPYVVDEREWNTVSLVTQSTSTAPQ